ERGSERSRENQKERLQYLAAGTEGTTAPQKAGYGAITDRAARIVNICPAALFKFFVCPIKEFISILAINPNYR
ncbi:MAG: hypothetical protein OSJ61_27960, partial [Lachnospiraceae bacterium]|nr:hypothetical protein [Lachnospiraceae bacterium]